MKIKKIIIQREKAGATQDNCPGLQLLTHIFNMIFSIAAKGKVLFSTRIMNNFYPEKKNLLLLPKSQRINYSTSVIRIPYLYNISFLFTTYKGVFVAGDLTSSTTTTPSHLSYTKSA